MLDQLKNGSEKVINQEMQSTWVTNLWGVKMQGRNANPSISGNMV